MGKKFFLTAGIVGLLVCNPHCDARAEFDVAGGSGDSSFYFETRPDFIYLNDYGFSVSYGGPYNVIYYQKAYYIFRGGYWHRAYDYQGPWVIITNYELPNRIRSHHYIDIWRHRDFEYRRYDRSYWDNRFRHDRDQWHERGGQPGQGGQGGGRHGQGGGGGQPGQGEQGGGRHGQREQGGGRHGQGGQGGGQYGQREQGGGRHGQGGQGGGQPGQGEQGGGRHGQGGQGGGRHGQGGDRP